MIGEGRLTGIDHRTACKNFVKAASKGVIKVASKMGISSLQSYRGAQVFEAVGLRQDVIDEYFTWTASRVGGIGIDVIAQEVLLRHGTAFSERASERSTLAVRRPVPVALGRRASPLQPGNRSTACRRRSATAATRASSEYSRIVDEQMPQSLCTLRGLLEFKPGDPVSDRGSRAGRVHRQALQDRRDVLRLDQQGGARDPRRSR